MVKKKHNNKDKFVVTTINFRKSDLDLFEKIIEALGYTSRSEAVRDMVRDWVEWKLEIMKQKQAFNEILDEYNKRKELLLNNKMVKVKRVSREFKINGTTLRQLEDIEIPREVYEELKTEGEIEDGIISNTIKNI